MDLNWLVDVVRWCIRWRITDEIRNASQLSTYNVNLVVSENRRPQANHQISLHGVELFRNDRLPGSGARVHSAFSDYNSACCLC